ncbi:VCBS repeat-containing protein [Namhaeicola litoreus]|uniref:VCBS repeat-containing protein n=1 Tax=Namhaeicola litoreus TaxID=1052145 RepID=A0ABW3XX21_9FLAO
MIRYNILCILVFLFLSCQNKEQNNLFEEIEGQDLGIDFVNRVNDSEELSILDYLYFYNGGGVSVGDINNDGLTDIFFVSNLEENKLYLNKGNLQFEDITQNAGVGGNSEWNSGVTMADVNGDGFLDIYVCAVVGINGFDGVNELFINNHDGTFTESAKKYGLDFETYASTASFFDYDNDGDLDMYLLNHAVHSVNSFGPATIRNKRIYESGDKLLRNDGNIFVDVSEEAGIFGGYNSYGLSIATADFNNDGFTDIYICNDFHEDDYFYLNNGNGTFTESLKKHFGHTSRFSMGSDVADINHDGFTDIITLDMLPEEEKVLKSSDGDEGLDILDLRIKMLGYHYQFSRNMLQINQGGANFLETALFSGVAATDWSWSALFADYNLDGEEDLFVFTGIPKRPNNLDYIKYYSNEEIQKKIDQTNLVDKEALKLMPSGSVKNYIFEGNEGIRFKDQTGNWISDDTLISNGAAYADFDNDGDLDVITNNLNQSPTLYKNNGKTLGNYLIIQFEYEKKNKFGIGTKVISFNQGEKQFKQLYTTKGFQSSSEPILNFGFGKSVEIDSLWVIWPDQTLQKIYKQKVNQKLVLKASKNREKFNLGVYSKGAQKVFKSINIDSVGILYEHRENDYNDFNRQKLIPYKISDKGPATVVGDFNGDGKEDVFFGSSIFSHSKLYFQNDGMFIEAEQNILKNDSLKEDVSAVIEDFNGDGQKDLFVMSSGGDYYRESVHLLDRVYYGDKTGLKEKADVMPNSFENGSVVRAFDYDKDGDVDLFIAGGFKAYDFGKIPKSYLVKNEGGKFLPVQTELFDDVGMISDFLWADLDGDDYHDLVMVGEWMSPRFFKNNRGKFEEIFLYEEEQLNGLWQQIKLFDIDQDGDEDIVLGNWGLNSKFKASSKYPLQMFYGDYDNNGTTETIIASEKEGKYYPLLGLDELASQINSLKKKFTSYDLFAGKDLDEVFEKELLGKMQKFEVQELASGYLENMKGKYRFRRFADELQLAPITRFLVYDFDKNGEKDLLLGGNFTGVIPFHGRLDAMPGYILESPIKFTSTSQLGLNLSNKLLRGFEIIHINHKEYLLVTLNDGKPELYHLETWKK